MKEKTLPCGHTDTQAAWLGCTETQCRPMDDHISAQYWQEKRGAAGAQRMQGNIPPGWREASG